mmetsp:Transcript_14787/g.31923  ORF Transcript_14787/g.31923 Transcript_14787/m.31923 type:complete len:703 (-) Transcript_14787:269-2377(-)
MDLQRILEEKTEELEGWRLRCLQAEAEVRALKRAGKALVVGTGGSRPSEPAPAPAPKDSEEVLALRAELQRLKDERTAESMQQPKEDLQAALARGNGMTAEVSELRKELQMRSEALLELQEQSSREAKRLDRQRKSAEAKQIVCHEELREMTQRAESLSEQVKKSKRRAADLQSARDESVELRRELAELRAEKAPVGSRVLATTTAAELGSSAPDEELRAALRPCFDSLRHLRGAWREQFPPNSSPSQAFERLITSLERAQQFCSTEGAGAGGSGPIPSATGTVVGKGSPFASLNPEGEHPPPEEKSHEWRIDQLQQELNEERLLGAELREELVMEHCNDLDDLVQRYDHERRELHEELRSIHQESSCAWASIQMAEPLASMKNYLETQVAKMQETLSAQMAELDQRRWEQREQDEMAMATLKERLANCLEELGASQADFKELVRQHWLEKQMRERGGQHQAGRASPATTPNPSSQASGSQGPSQGPSQGHHRQTSQTQGGSQSQGLLQQQQQQQQQQQRQQSADAQSRRRNGQPPAPPSTGNRSPSSNVMTVQSSPLNGGNGSVHRDNSGATVPVPVPSGSTGLAAADRSGPALSPMGSGGMHCPSPGTSPLLSSPTAAGSADVGLGSATVSCGGGGSAIVAGSGIIAPAPGNPQSSGSTLANAVPSGSGGTPAHATAMSTGRGSTTGPPMAIINTMERRD